MNKRILYSFAAVLVHFAAMAQLSSTPPSGGNQKSVTRQYLGSVAFVEVAYSSPHVGDREGKIWGQLVPYGLSNLGFGDSNAENPSPWRAGANENTTFTFSHDVTVQGQPLKAGTYGFHVIPQESGDWTLIFTDEYRAWGSYFYKPSQEVLRVQATPKACAFQDDLTYEFSERRNEGVTVSLKWEKLELPFKVALPDANAVTLAAIEDELRGTTKGFVGSSYVQAAMWASGAGLDEKALQWADFAINDPFFGQKSFVTLQTKATILNKMGRQQEAIPLMDEAIRMPGVNVFQIHQYGRQLIAAGEKQKALEVFLYNHKQNKGVWPTDYGLARAYSALGDYKNALKYLKIAQTKIPEGDTLNPPAIAANLEKLQKGEDIN